MLPRFSAALSGLFFFLRYHRSVEFPTPSTLSLSAFAINVTDRRRHCLASRRLLPLRRHRRYPSRSPAGAAIEREALSSPSSSHRLDWLEFHRLFSASTAYWSPCDHQRK
ncbi:hypothetical protein COCNU_scaffold024208G000040 [Cocos nucifera]|nr:hypothetical protein [Cocos nucifera]